MNSCRACNSLNRKLFSTFDRRADSLDIKASGSSPLSTDLWVCNNCKLISQFPEHSKKYVENLYKNEDDHTFIQFNDSRIISFDNIIKYLVKKNILKSGMHGVDIGCAGGAFPKAAEMNDMNIIGIEPSKFLSSYAREVYKLTIFNGFFAEVKDKLPENLDIVTLWDVIEHVYDLNGLIKDINCKIKRKGLLVINTPVIDSLPAKILQKKWPMLLDVHLHYFTQQSLSNLLSKHGYKLTFKTRYFQTLPIGYILKRAMDYITKKNSKSMIYQLNFPLKYYIGQKCFVFQKEM